MDAIPPPARPHVLMPARGHPPAQPELGYSGRPLEIDGATRLAALRERKDWSLRAVGPASIDVGHRAALAAAWRADAQEEHASIASFQRFGLDLVALGAPPGLIEDASRAVIDEVAHARFAFGVAQQLDGNVLGPDRLALHGLVVRSELIGAAIAAVREGCVGESLAAVCASAAAKQCTDPTLANALAGLATDEARHSELAWRFVAWAVRTGGDELRAVITQAFAEAVECAPALDDREAILEGVPDVLRLRFGRLPKGEGPRLRARALVELIGPAAANMLAVT